LKKYCKHHCTNRYRLSVMSTTSVFLRKQFNQNSSKRNCSLCHVMLRIAFRSTCFCTNCGSVQNTQNIIKRSHLLCTFWLKIYIQSFVFFTTNIVHRAFVSSVNIVQWEWNSQGSTTKVIDFLLIFWMMYILATR